jgi:hypothetical protein
MNTRGVKRGADGEQRDEELLQERDALQRRVAELEQENGQFRKENDEFRKENGQFRKENNKFKHVLEEMKSKVECPVCLVVPRAGPVPQCPRGHFLCSGCKAVQERAGRRDCPTCRGPMGEAHSLLASLVIENVQHDCSFKDCEVKVPLNEYERHQDLCGFRPVRCPGNCGTSLAFNNIFLHIRSGCPGNMKIVERFTKKYTIPNVVVRDFTTRCSNVDSRLFFVQVSKLLGDLYRMEVVMVGSQEDCNKYNAEISVLDTNLHPTFKFSHHPRPISLQKWGDLALTIGEQALLKICEHCEDDGRFKFIVKVVINRC